MEKINETNLISSVCKINKVQIEKNEKNDISEKEQEDSLEEEWEPEVEEKKQKQDHRIQTIAVIEETKQKIKSNLEFLLSQNDILPLLKKLNKDRTIPNGKFSLDKFAKNGNNVKIIQIKIYLKKNFFIKK